MRKTMKILLLTGSLILSGIQLNAQTAYPIDEVESVKPTNTFKLPTKENSCDLYDVKHYRVLIQNDWRNSSRLFIKFMNEDASEQSESIEYKYEKGYEFQQLFKFDERLFILTKKRTFAGTYGYSKPITTEFHYTEVLPESKSFGTPTFFYKGTDFNKINTTEENQLVIETSSIDNTSDETTKIEYQIFDKNLELKKEGEITLPVLVDSYLDYYGRNLVGNHLNYLVLVRHKKMGGLVLASYNLEDDTKIAKLVDIGVNYIKDFNFRLVDDNTLVGYGLYSENETDFSDGIISFRYSISGDEIQHVSKIPFPKETVEQFNEKVVLQPVSIKFSNVENNGTLYITAEEYYIFSTSKYAYGAVYVIAINKNGELEYSKKLPKKLLSYTKYDRVNFGTEDLGDSFLFYYLDSPDNKNLSFNQEPVATNVQGKYNCDLVALKMDKATGNITKYVLFNTEEFKQKYGFNFDEFYIYDTVIMNNKSLQFLFETGKLQRVLIDVDL